MGISWSIVWWCMGLWVAGWIAAKIVSVRKGWDHGFVEKAWVLTCCTLAASAVILQLWVLPLVPILAWIYKDTDRRLEAELRRRVEWHNWADDWGKTEYLYERRVPRRS